MKIEKQKEDSLNQLKTALSFATAKYNEMSEAERNAAKGKEMQKNIDEITAKIKQEEEALGNHRRSVGEYAKAGKEMRAEVKELTNALAGMREQGMQNSAEYSEMNKRLNELKTTMAGTSETTKTLDATTQSVSATFADFSAYQAILAQNTDVSDEYLEVMKNMQVALVMLTT